MENYSTELLKVILNVLGVGLWVITIVYLMINRLKRNHKNSEQNNKEDILNFSEEMILQTNKNLKKAVEPISNKMSKGSQSLSLFTEKTDTRKASPFRNGFRDTGKKAGRTIDDKVDDDYSHIVKLANMGLSAKEVSEKVKMPKGEVELIIKLRGQRYEYNGSSKALHA